MASHNSLLCLMAIFLVFISSTQGINVLNVRADNPIPDGSGVVVVQLLGDPSDADINSLTAFNITSTNFVNGAQTLRLYDTVAEDCSGALLTSGAGSNQVPTNGLVCFLSNITDGGAAEFQNSFDYIALGGSDSSNVGTVTIINYNKQICTSIPDLGASGSFKAPPQPTVSITLSGLEINFSVNATYVRNQTSWFLDFFSFDNSAGGDSADGTGRTCSNHKPSNYPASFSDWWYSGVRANFDTSISSTIDNALNDAVYPNYDALGTVWTLSDIDCSTINFQTTIPVSQLVGNSTGDCYQTGNGLPAATTSGGLVYTGTLYVNAIRPIDETNSALGYFMSTFAFPFTFSIQTTVSQIVSTSDKWAFAVDVLNSQVTYTGGSPSYTLDLETSISAPTVDSPTVLGTGFSLPAYPLSTLRSGIGSAVEPTLSRIGDNGDCNQATTSPCVIQWRMVMPQLSLAQLSNSQSGFDTQYSGEYSFQWVTNTGDTLASDIYVDVSAANPSTNLSQIPVSSSVNFFASQANMQNTSNGGESTPVFSSGEKIWVRHSFIVDPSDIQAFIFTLSQAFVCFSKVPGFVPTLSNGGTGCSVDIPGVMEASQGERYVLYDQLTLPGGIANVVASLSGEQSLLWDWDKISPSTAGWTSDSTVNNGFSINAQPLAVDGVKRTYYFQVVSIVTQTSLGRRQTRQVTQLYRVNDGESSGVLQGVQIVPSASESTSSSDASELKPALAAFLTELFSN